MGPVSKWFGLLGDSIKMCVKMSLHQYFVAFTNTAARENAELHVLCMFPGILVLGCSYNLVPRGGDPLGQRLGWTPGWVGGWNEHDNLR